ncbi:hypothetical protein BJV74DRAFT_872375 [Russula compacta]|nr:hypothetical protein BJV74DRAFT_872375 [Russula compacta]
MSGRILSDGSEGVHVDKRPRRNPAPTTKLLGKDNLQQAALPLQRKSTDDYRAAHEAQDISTATSDLESPDTTSRATSPTSTQIPDTYSSPTTLRLRQGQEAHF